MLKYPSRARFPATPVNGKEYLASDTGEVYVAMSGIYQPFWPGAANRFNTQTGVIGSNRTLQDTIHVRS